jgi:hypothetical protein
MSRVSDPPVPADSGTTLGVLKWDGDTFPNPPFRALLWPVQTLPVIGTNACYINVSEVIGDQFTFTREDPTGAIYPNQMIGVVSTFDIFDEGDTVRLRASFPGGDTAPGTVVVRNPHGVVSQISSGVVVDAPGEFHYDLVADSGGHWFARWLADGGDTNAYHFFVNFDTVGD